MFFSNMFGHIWKQLFPSLISKRIYRRKCDDVPEKPEFWFLPEKCHLVQMKFYYFDFSMTGTKSISHEKTLYEFFLNYDAAIQLCRSSRIEVFQKMSS